MSERARVRIPKYRLHKPTSLAVVRLSGRDVYLGPYGSAESEARYHTVVNEWLRQDRKPPPRPTRTAAKAELVVDELILAYLDFARSYYRKNGEPSGELENIRDALRFLTKLFGSRRVSEFSAPELRTVRDAMIRSGLCRNVINARINRIRRLFKWGVERGHVDPIGLHALQSLSPLQHGRSAARETVPVGPVPEELIDPVLAQVPRQVAAMIQLQRYTGMRPGEVMSMRTCDIDCSGRLWLYRPSSHKTQHFGRERLIYLGPRAQEELEPFLKPEVPQACLFSPREAVFEIRRRRRMNRNSRPTPSELAKRVPIEPSARFADRYNRRSYGHAVARGCRKAFPPPVGLSATARSEWIAAHHWAPNQLRHNAATFLRKQFGIEAARVVLGHSSAATTEIYAELDLRRAAEVMEEVG